MFSPKTWTCLAAGMFCVTSTAAIAQMGGAEEMQERQQEQQVRQPGQQATGENLRTISGTVVDVEAYLIHGKEQAASAQNQKAQLDPSDPVAIVTDDDQVYLLLDRQEITGQQPQMRGPQLGQAQQPGQIGAQQQDQAAQAQQRQQQDQMARAQQEQQRQQLGQAERDPDFTYIEAQPGEADEQQRQARAQQPGELGEMDEEGLTTEQQQRTDVFGIDRPQPGAQQAGQEDPAFERMTQQQVDQRRQQEPRDAAIAQPLQLRAGQRVTLTGQVHERSGLRGIVVSGYSVQGGEAQPQQRPGATE